MSDREDLIGHLASVFDDESTAQALLDQIDFPRGHRPAFKTSALFWREIGREIDKGRVADGLERLRAAAAEEYPHNPVFQPLAGGPLAHNEERLVDQVFDALAHYDEIWMIFAPYPKDADARQPTTWDATRRVTHLRLA